MDYKNLIIRTIIAIIFIGLYLLLFKHNIFIVVSFSLIYFAIFYEVVKYFNNNIKIIIIYLFISLFSFYIYGFYYYNYFDFNIFIFSIILFDTFSYVCGNYFGKNLILKKISPKKTLEGLIGGIIFTNLLILIFFYLNIKNYDLLSLMIFLNSIIFFSFIGDILQSYFKRKNNLKNSSELIPGHGGIFDRFDSFLFSIIFYSISNIIL